MDRQLIITIDGLNARMLGPYGNNWIPTSFFNFFAAQGIVFDQFLAERDDLNANLLAMLEGRHALAQRPAEQQSPRSDLLITDDQRLSDEVKDHFNNIELIHASDSDRYDVLFGSVVESLARAAEKMEDSPCPLWVHSSGLSGNWVAPVDYQDRFKDETDPEPIEINQPPSLMLPADFDPDERLTYLHAYAAELLHLDQHLNDLREALVSLGYAGNMVVCGVRGFPLGEHREVGLSGSTLYAEKIQLPFIMTSPGKVPFRVPSLLGCHQFQDQVESAGHDQHHSAAEIVVSANNHWARIQTKAWAYLHPITEAQFDNHSGGQLYSKPDDPLEINEVSDVCPDIARHLHDELDRQINTFLAGSLPEKAALDPSVFTSAT